MISWGPNLRNEKGTTGRQVRGWRGKNARLPCRAQMAMAEHIDTRGAIHPIGWREPGYEKGDPNLMRQIFEGKGIPHIIVLLLLPERS